MSVHLVEMAAEVNLPPSLKLALLCFADSGSTDGRVARPGLENLMRWTGLKKSRALEVVRRLEELQLLGSHRSAHRGQRAEYIVFPNGCCEKHGKASATVLTSVDANGSTLPDPFSLSTVSGPPDPIAGNGSDFDSRKGPISEAERVRSSRSKVEPSKYLTPKDSTPVPTDLQPLTPRDLAGVVPPLDFSLMTGQPARDVRVVTPRGKPLGCRHCDAGFVTDGDGLPLARCPHCNPSTRMETA